MRVNAQAQQSQALRFWFCNPSLHQTHAGQCPSTTIPSVAFLLCNLNRHRTHAGQCLSTTIPSVACWFCNPSSHQTHAGQCSSTTIPSVACLLCNQSKTNKPKQIYPCQKSAHLHKYSNNPTHHYHKFSSISSPRPTHDRIPATITQDAPPPRRPCRYARQDQQTQTQV